MNTSKIEWTKHTWNPVTGCSPVSPACDHCYARRMAQRLRGRFGYPADDPFRPTLHIDKLEEPLHWRKPSRVFACSMSDLFHEDVPDDTIDAVFAVMAEAQQHTFLVLTKRPEGMQRWFTDTRSGAQREQLVYETCSRSVKWPGWPLPHCWLGVTAEDQQRADERIPILLDTPAAKRFVSCEPLLEAIDLRTLHRSWASYTDALRGWTTGGEARGDHARLDWLIVGAETGPGARPMQPEWAHDLYEQCRAAGVPFFFKKGTPGINYDPAMVATRELPS